MTAVVVGTGYTGLRLLRRLPADRALGLSRSVPPDTDGRDVRKLNLDEENTSIELPTDYSLVYTVPPAIDADEDYRLERLLEELDPAPRRIVYLSTTGVYGDRRGERVSEDDPTAPKTPRAARRVAAETALAKFAETAGSEITILRVPGIYGPDRLMIDRVRDKEPLIADSEANPGNRIHVDDLVSACLAALDPARPPGIYNLGDGDTRSSTWFATTVARLLDWEPPPEISRAEAEEAFSPRRMSFLNESRRIDTTKMHEVLGVELRYENAEEGIHASLVEMGLLK